MEGASGVPSGPRRRIRMSPPGRPGRTTRPTALPIQQVRRREVVLRAVSDALIWTVTRPAGRARSARPRPFQAQRPVRPSRTGRGPKDASGVTASPAVVAGSAEKVMLASPSGTAVTRHCVGGATSVTPADAASATAIAGPSRSMTMRRLVRKTLAPAFARRRSE